MKVRILSFTYLRYLGIQNDFIFKYNLTTPSKLKNSKWVNFFKEAFLFDYFYKIWFFKFTQGYLIKGPLLFNFNFINKLQLKSLYNFLYTLNLSIKTSFDLVLFFSVLFKSILWLIFITTLTWII